MSRHPSNPFGSGNQSSAEGRYAFSSMQPEMDSHRVTSDRGPESSSSPGVSSAVSGIMIPQMPPSLSYRPERSRTRVVEDLKMSVDIHCSRAREEVRYLGNPDHRSMGQIARFTSTQRVTSGRETFSYPQTSSSAYHSQKYPDVESDRSSLNWLPKYKGSTGEGSSTSYSSSSSSSHMHSGDGRISSSTERERDLDLIPGLGDSDYRVPDKCVDPPETSHPRYTSQSAVDILSRFGLEKEDLEYLISYPEDQLTPTNLPFILRQICLDKDRNSTVEMKPYSGSQPIRGTGITDSASITARSSASFQTPKVIDYGHTGNYVGGTLDDIGRTTSANIGGVVALDTHEQRTTGGSQEPSKKETKEFKISPLIFFSDQSRASTGFGSSYPTVAPPNTDQFDQRSSLYHSANLSNKDLHDQRSAAPLLSTSHQPIIPPNKDQSVPVAGLSSSYQPVAPQNKNSHDQSRSVTSLRPLFYGVPPPRNEPPKGSQKPQHPTSVPAFHPFPLPKKDMHSVVLATESKPLPFREPEPKTELELAQPTRQGHVLIDKTYSKDTKGESKSEGQKSTPVLKQSKTEPEQKKDDQKPKKPSRFQDKNLIKAIGGQGQLTSAIINDYLALHPKVYPHKCSLCHTECRSKQEWIYHLNTSVHLESCRHLQTPSTNKDAKYSSTAAAKTSQKSRNKSRRGSHSHSRSSSPRRYRSSEGKRQKQSLSRSSSSGYSRSTNKDAKYSSSAAAKTSQKSHKKSRHSHSRSSSPRRYRSSEGKRQKLSRSRSSSSGYSRSRSRSPRYDRYRSRSGRSSSSDRWSSPKRSRERRVSPKSREERWFSPPRQSSRKRDNERGRSRERERDDRRSSEDISSRRSCERHSSPRSRVDNWKDRKSPPRYSHDRLSSSERSLEPKKSSSVERLVNKLLEQTAGQAQTESNLEAVVKTLLTEISKKKSSLSNKELECSASICEGSSTAASSSTTAASKRETTSAQTSNCSFSGAPAVSAEFNLGGKMKKFRLEHSLVNLDWNIVCASPFSHILMMIPNLPDYKYSPYTEEQLANVLATHGFVYEDENIYVAPLRRIAFFYVPPEVARRILGQRITVGNKPLFVRVLKLDLELKPFAFYEFLVEKPKKSSIGPVMYVKNISMSQTRDLRQTLKTIKGLINFVPLLNKVFIEFQTKTAANALEVWYNRQDPTPDYRICLFNDDVPAVQNQVEESTDSAPVPMVTEGEKIETFLSGKRMETFPPQAVMSPNFMKLPLRVVLIRNLPAYKDGSYTEEELANVLTGHTFAHENKAIYVVPQAGMAFYSMPPQLVLAILRKPFIFKGKKLRLDVLNFCAPLTPFTLYQFLMKKVRKSAKFNRGDRIIFVKNISPSQKKELRAALATISGFVNFLPLLNKVFVEFKSMVTADVLGVWYSFLKKAPDYRIYRMSIPTSGMELLVDASSLPKEIAERKIIVPATVIPRDVNAPFWITTATQPFVFPTCQAWFRVPRFITVKHQRQPSLSFISSSSCPVIMLTGLPQDHYTHLDVVRLVWSYFPEQNLQALYYHVVVLTLQKRAFVRFSSLSAFQSFVRDHEHDTIKIGDHSISIHLITQPMVLESTEELMFMSLLKLSNAPPPNPNGLVDRLLCVEIAEATINIITVIMEVVSSIANVVRFLPLANRIIVEMADSSAVLKVVETYKEHTPSTGTRSAAWNNVVRFESAKSLKQRLQDSGHVAIPEPVEVKQGSSGTAAAAAAAAAAGAPQEEHARKVQEDSRAPESKQSFNMEDFVTVVEVGDYHQSSSNSKESEPQRSWMTQSMGGTEFNSLPSPSSSPKSTDVSRERSSFSRSTSKPSKTAMHSSTPSRSTVTSSSRSSSHLHVRETSSSSAPQSQENQPFKSFSSGAAVTSLAYTTKTAEEELDSSLQVMDRETEDLVKDDFTKQTKVSEKDLVKVDNKSDEKPAAEDPVEETRDVNNKDSEQVTKDSHGKGDQSKTEGNEEEVEGNSTSAGFCKSSEEARKPDDQIPKDEVLSIEESGKESWKYLNRDVTDQETCKVLDSTVDHSSMEEEGGQDLEAPSDYVSQENKDIYEVLDSIEDQPSYSDEKRKRSRKDKSTRKDQKPSTRSGQKTRATAAEEKLQGKNKDQQTKEVLGEMEFEVKDSVGDDPVQESTSGRSDRRSVKGKEKKQDQMDLSGISDSMEEKAVTVEQDVTTCSTGGRRERSMRREAFIDKTKREDTPTRRRQTSARETSKKEEQTEGRTPPKKSKAREATMVEATCEILDSEDDEDEQPTTRGREKLKKEKGAPPMDTTVIEVNEEEATYEILDSLEDEDVKVDHPVKTRGRRGRSKEEKITKNKTETLKKGRRDVFAKEANEEKGGSYQILDVVELETDDDWPATERSKSRRMTRASKNDKRPTNEGASHTRSPGSKEKEEPLYQIVDAVDDNQVQDLMTTVVNETEKKDEGHPKQKTQGVIKETATVVESKEKTKEKTIDMDPPAEESKGPRERKTSQEEDKLQEETTGLPRDEEEPLYEIVDSLEEDQVQEEVSKGLEDDICPKKESQPCCVGAAEHAEEADQSSKVSNTTSAAEDFPMKKTDIRKATTNVLVSLDEVSDEEENFPEDMEEEEEEMRKKHMERLAKYQQCNTRGREDRNIRGADTREEMPTCSSVAVEMDKKAVKDLEEVSDASSPVQESWETPTKVSKPDETVARNTLVNLDVVSDEEEDFPNDNTEEEDLKKKYSAVKEQRLANEHKAEREKAKTREREDERSCRERERTSRSSRGGGRSRRECESLREMEVNIKELVTLDEVGADEIAEEASVQSRDLDGEFTMGELQGLVTLDEVVDEEEDGKMEPVTQEDTGPPTSAVQSAEALNIETLVALDETGGDEEEKVETPEKTPSSLKRKLDLEDSMNSVTVDEIVEEEEEIKPTVKTRGRAKRIRKTPVRKSARGKKAAAKDECEEQKPGSEEPSQHPATLNKDQSQSRSENQPEIVKVEAEGEGLGQELQLEDQSLEEPEEKERDKSDEKAASKRKAELPGPESKRSRSRTTPCSATLPPFHPDQNFGQDFVVPTLGFFCNLCRVFYVKNTDEVKDPHCSSRQHYENLQNHFQNLQPKPSGRRSTRSCPGFTSD